MTFLWMPALWLMVLIPIAVGLYLYMLRRRKAAAVRYASLSMVKQAMGKGANVRRHLPPALFLAALTLMLLAVARPAAVITLASQRATVMLAMDVSGSMRAQDVEPSRLEAAKTAAKTFIKDMPRDVRIGVVAFAGTAFLVQPPTNVRDDLYVAIDRLELQRGTATGSGILSSLQTIFPDYEFDLGEPRWGRGDPWGGGGGSPLGAEEDASRQGGKQPPPPAVPPGRTRGGSRHCRTARADRAAWPPAPRDAAGWWRYGPDRPGRTWRRSSFQARTRTSLTRGRGPRRCPVSRATLSCCLLTRSCRLTEARYSYILALRVDHRSWVMQRCSSWQFSLPPHWVASRGSSTARMMSATVTCSRGRAIQ